MSTEVGETGIEKVRKKCMTQGFSRMKCFSTIFRQFDKDHNKELTLHEFQKGLKAYEVDMDDYEIENLFNLLDKDRWVLGGNKNHLFQCCLRKIL